MPKGQNKDFIVAGIINLMRTNYNVQAGLLDIEAIVDETLSFEENWNNIKPKVLQLCENPLKLTW